MNQSNYACCSNPSMKFRSEGDQSMNPTYCKLSLDADTNMFVNYRSYPGKEGYCASGRCGDVKASYYYSLQKANQFNPGTGPNVYEGFTTAAPCGCSGGPANRVYQGSGPSPSCGLKNYSGRTPAPGV